MTLTLEIPPALEQRLRTIASERGIPVEQIGEQALSAGLATLSGTIPDVVLQLSTSDMMSNRTLPSIQAIQMPSPLKTSGLPRTLTIIVEPAMEQNDHAD